MAWTVTDWTTNPDWHGTNLDEFEDAINERRQACGHSPITAWLDTDLQDPGTFALGYQNILLIQKTIYSMMSVLTTTPFVVSHSGGSPLGAGYYDASVADPLPVYESLEDGFSAAGAAKTHFRRYAVHPDDGGSVAYDFLEVGDVIGPWLFEDIQKLLNVMVWTYVTAHGWVNGDNYEGYGQFVGAEGAASWAAAKALAETDWQRVGDGGVQWADSFGDAYGEFAPLPGGDTVYDAILTRDAAAGRETDIWNGCNRDADWYAWTTAQGTWDDNSDDVLEDQWSLWLTDAPATDATTVVSSSELSDASVKPVWCDEPARGGATLEKGYDWDGNASTVVFRWNVTNGFVYQ